MTGEKVRGNKTLTKPISVDDYAITKIRYIYRQHKW